MIKYRRLQGHSGFPQATYALIALTLVWGMFVARLYELQVRDRAIYEVKSEDNRIVRLIKLAARGEIQDRKNFLLAATRFSADLVIPNRKMRVREIDALAQKLAPVLQTRPDRIRDAYLSALRKTYGYQAVPIYTNLSETQTVRVGENLWQFPEIRLQKRLARWYPSGEMMCHTLGYVNEVSKDDMERDPNYRLGSVIGRAGIEEILESHLKGKDGWKWAEVDAQGRIRRDLDDLPAPDPSAGATVQLTLDLKLSRAFEDAFGDSNGFGLIMDATSGAVRAIFSRPGFDPNRLVTTDIEYIRQLQTDTDHPFFNRAVQSAFPPGSTFKTINFVAGVEAGLASEQTTFYCSGKFHLGRRLAECWKSTGHGKIALIPALTHSCNIYFYKLGLQLTGERLASAGKMFRLGEKTGFILSGEPAGILPSPEWKKQRYGEEWTSGDDVNMSIGQGFLLVTPLQQVTVMASLFNGGQILKPYLVERIVSPSGEILVTGEPQIRSTLTIADSTVTMVRTALREVVVRGTGYRAGHDARYRAYPVDVYGKTGTVQRAGREAVERAGQEPEDHGWFLCYFELNGEKFAAVVMKEAAGHGGSVAAPVIGRFIEMMLKSPA